MAVHFQSAVSIGCDNDPLELQQFIVDVSAQLDVMLSPIGIAVGVGAPPAWL